MILYSTHTHIYNVILNTHLTTIAMIIMNIRVNTTTTIVLVTEIVIFIELEGYKRGVK